MGKPKVVGENGTRPAVRGKRALFRQYIAGSEAEHFRRTQEQAM